MKKLSNVDIALCIVGMSIVSYIPRALPPFILAKTKISPLLERWLKYVPTAVFGSLVFSQIFISNKELNFSLSNVSLWTSIIVVIIAAKTKSLAKSIVLGLITFWFLKNYLL